MYENLILLKNLRKVTAIAVLRTFELLLQKITLFKLALY